MFTDHWTGPEKSDKPEVTQLAGDRGRPGPLLSLHTSWAAWSPAPLGPAWATVATSAVVVAGVAATQVGSVSGPRSDAEPWGPRRRVRAWTPSPPGEQTSSLYHNRRRLWGPSNDRKPRNEVTMRPCSPQTLTVIAVLPGVARGHRDARPGGGSDLRPSWAGA